MSNTTTSAPVAGWYRDPGDHEAYRWWDGVQWTQQVQSSGYLTYDPSARHLGSAQTVPIWLLAFWPFVGGAVVGLTQGFAIPLLAQLGVPPVIGGLSGFLVGIIAAWVLAGLDIRILRRRGYEPPSILWMLLLPPLAYFIARGRRVRRMGGRAWPPELAFFLSLGLIVVSAVVSTILSLSLLRAAGIDPFGQYAEQYEHQQQLSVDPDEPLTNSVGYLPDSDEPLSIRISTYLNDWFGYQVVDELDGLQCPLPDEISSYPAQFPCDLYDFEPSDGDQGRLLLVKIDSTGFVSYSDLS